MAFSSRGKVKSLQIDVKTESLEQPQPPPEIPPMETEAEDSIDAVKRSAERIAGYLSAYSGQGDGSHTNRTQIPPQIGNDSLIAVHRSIPGTATHKGQRTILIDHTAADRQAAKLKKLTRELEDLEGAIRQARSDKLELQRDLYTFEYGFDTKVRLEARLREVQNTADSMPAASTAYEAITAAAFNIYSLIRSGLSQLRTSLPTTALPTPLTRSLNFHLRPTGTTHHLHTCFRGAQALSGRVILLRIKGDKTLKDLWISGQTLSGQKLSLKVKLSPALNGGNPKKDIKTRILPFLYLQVNKKREIELGLSEENERKFRAVFVNLKGARKDVLLQIKEDNEEVKISVPSFDLQIFIPIEKFPGQKSVFSFPMRALKRVLEEKLMLFRDPDQLKWYPEGASRSSFKAKEKTSKLMDPEYLSMKLHDFVQVLVSMNDIQIDGQRYTIELYAHKAVEKLRINSRDRSEEVGMDSANMKLLKDLQFSLLQKSEKTTLLSLELVLVIRNLFSGKNKHGEL